MCIKVDVDVRAYSYQVSWSISDFNSTLFCKGYGYRDYKIYRNYIKKLSVQENNNNSICCLPPGEYELQCNKEKSNSLFPRTYFDRAKLQTKRQV